MVSGAARCHGLFMSRGPPDGGAVPVCGGERGAWCAVPHARLLHARLRQDGLMPLPCATVGVALGLHTSR